MYSMSTLKFQKRSIFLSICFVICLLFASAASTHAAAFTVTNTDDSGTGSLPQAIIDANTLAGDDTIDFSLSNCPCTIILTSGRLDIDSNLTIDGPGASQLTVVRDPLATTFRIFKVNAGITVSIGGLTVSGGKVEVNQGLEGRGGGIVNYGTLTVTNSAVSGNWAINYGGGIYSEVGATLTVVNSTVSHNFVFTSGGGIYSSGPLTVTNSTVSDNEARFGFGGGISCGGRLTLANSTVSANSAVSGGGIVNSGPTTVTNGTVFDNRATSGLGGGIYQNGGSVNLNSSILANNTASFLGPDFAGYEALGDYNLIKDASGIGSLPGTHNIIGVDPMLGPLQDNGGSTFTHALLAGSPAIGVGDPGYAGPLTTDQRGTGFVRVVNGRIDIGAFEVQTVICPRPQGYWKNNPDAWPVDSLTLGSETYSKAELLAILNTPAGTGRNADASLILAYQLIAAKLNAETGANTGSVDATIEAADELLTGLGGRLPLRVRSSSADGQLMVGYGSTLDAFNKATTTLGCSQ